MLRAKPQEVEMPRYDNILETIGNTPLVKLNKLAPPGVNVYVKVESFNPMGSVKDRMARAVIEAAEQSGELKPGQTVIEATSGNTGIGLAMVCAQKGYPLVVTMAESFSIERRKMLRFLGAKVILTPASEKGTGMLNKAVELAETHGWFLCRQFENAANAEVHRRTTAPEILADLDGEPLHYFVTGFGTGGTLLGVSRAFKLDSPDTRIVAAEPDNSQVLGSGIPQSRDASGAPAGSHPHFRPHLMQGWSPNRRSPKAWSTRSCRSPATMPCGCRGNSLARKASSSELRVARRWQRRCRWQRACPPAPTSCACCPIPVSATCRHPCSRTSARK
jgi:cysteine synthase A